MQTRDIRDQNNLFQNNHNAEFRPLFHNGALDRPLFGADTSRERIINLVVGFVTALLVLVTIILSFTLHGWSMWGLNAFFSICIMFICIGHLLLVYWYREGDLDPKFRNLIFLNSFTIVMLCVCAICYITLAKDPDKAAPLTPSSTVGHI